MNEEKEIRKKRKKTSMSLFYEPSHSDKESQKKDCRLVGNDAVN
ncbi:MAG: hypothetical protein WBA22_11720 [Candidatus Methanofastidiosia archaeon]